MIKIAHLYYDLMNLYGDNGNIKALKIMLEEQGLKVDISLLTIGDKIDFNKYDLFYIGPGTFDNEKLVLNDLMQYKDDIKKAIEDNKFFIAVGNSLDLFGKKINDEDGLNIFNFDTTKITKRLVGEVYLKAKIVSEMLVGFKNQDSIINFEDNTIFDVIKGYGLNENSDKEGILINNFFGTYIIGPIFVRNPELLVWYTKKIMHSKDKEFDPQKVDLGFEEEAHDEFIKNYFNDEVA